MFKKILFFALVASHSAFGMKLGNLGKNPFASRSSGSFLSKIGTLSKNFTRSLWQKSSIIKPKFGGFRSSLSRFKPFGSAKRHSFFQPLFLGAAGFAASQWIFGGLHAENPKDISLGEFLIKLGKDYNVVLNEMKNDKNLLEMYKKIIIDNFAIIIERERFYWIINFIREVIKMDSTMGKQLQAPVLKNLTIVLKIRDGELLVQDLIKQCKSIVNFFKDNNDQFIVDLIQSIESDFKNLSKNQSGIFYIMKDLMQINSSASEKFITLFVQNPEIILENKRDFYDVFLSGGIIFYHARYMKKEIEYQDIEKHIRKFLSTVQNDRNFWSNDFYTLYFDFLAILSPHSVHIFQELIKDSINSKSNMKWFTQTMAKIMLQEDPKSAEFLCDSLLISMQRVLESPGLMFLVKELLGNEHYKTSLREKIVHNIKRDGYLNLQTLIQVAHYEIFFDEKIDLVKKIKSPTTQHFFANCNRLLQSDVLKAFLENPTLINLTNQVIALESQLQGKYHTFIHGQRGCYLLPELVNSWLQNCNANRPYDNFIYLHVKSLNKTEKNGKKRRKELLNMGRTNRSSSDRKLLLFLNWALFANENNHGSNSAKYIMDNSNVQFMSLSFKSVFELNNQTDLYLEFESRLEHLQKEYNEIATAGTCIVIAIPKVEKQVFAAEVGGAKKTVHINSVGKTTDISTIMKTLNENPESMENDEIEFCMPMTSDKYGGLNPGGGIRIFIVSPGNPSALDAWYAQVYKLRDDIFQAINKRKNGDQNV